MNIEYIVNIALQIFIMIMLRRLYKKGSYKAIFTVSLLLSLIIIVENLGNIIG